MKDDTHPHVHDHLWESGLKVLFLCWQDKTRHIFPHTSHNTSAIKITQVVRHGSKRLGDLSESEEESEAAAAAEAKAKAEEEGSFVASLD